MTEQEAHALAQLLALRPMSQAEALWVKQLIERLTVKPDKKAAASTPGSTP